jgi:hypothetical protein
MVQLARIDKETAPLKWARHFRALAAAMIPTAPKANRSPVTCQCRARAVGVGTGAAFGPPLASPPGLISNLSFASFGPSTDSELRAHSRDGLRAGEERTCGRQHRRGISPNQVRTVRAFARTASRVRETYWRAMLKLAELR